MSHDHTLTKWCKISVLGDLCLFKKNSALSQRLFYCVCGWKSVVCRSCSCLNLRRLQWVEYDSCFNNVIKKPNGPWTDFIIWATLCSFCSNYKQRETRRNRNLNQSIWRLWIENTACKITFHSIILLASPMQHDDQQTVKLPVVSILTTGNNKQVFRASWLAAVQCQFVNRGAEIPSRLRMTTYFCVKRVKSEDAGIWIGIVLSC